MNYFLLYWWVPILILFYSSYGYISVKNNESHDYTRWFWLSLVLGFCPLWAFVSKHSKYLAFDSFLYDVLLFFSFNLVILLGGGAKQFSTVNWVGIVLITAGFILVRLGIH
jgi:uncharacterized membrane protein